LTESTLIKDSDAVNDQLLELKALGVEMAIDDFGTGYSSLGYLWRYQFERLKIDRSFLEGFEYDNQRYRRIIETIVLLGHQLNMKVTVEGVENAQQLAEMRKLGCDLFQGFLMSRPVARTDAAALVTHSSGDEGQVGNDLAS
jgi:EAL domain-containing protein (putative c-di-GMP-specific phosphodiesterase class I)